MVLYYSATGNTEYIAQEIAKGLNDECLNLLDKIKRNDLTPINSETPFVICAPVIVCEIPRFMSKFLKKVPLTGNKNVYFILTSGGYSGAAGPLAKSLIKKKKMNYLGHADFIMPQNYMASDAYGALTRDEIEDRIRSSVKLLSPTVETIKKGENLMARKVAFWETAVTVPFNPVWCKFLLNAKDFHIEGECSSCGKCVKVCPLNNIKLTDKKPVWGKDCTHCMACIGNCPTEAIEYKNITQKKEKYNFGKYKYVVK
ncbi:MAG: EFR1 family ferrodoxin [Clostridia bacterium]|nr:EFR1 family ferrodoxin [Clostridia bacterium]